MSATEQVADRMAEPDRGSKGTSGARLLVFSQLFPSDVQPNAGLFVRERMFRVAKRVPILVVVAPQAWFPLQGIIRMFRPHFRPMASRHEVQQGIEVYRPRFFSVPGALKRLDGLFLALSSFFTVRRLVRKHGLNVLDAHFGYPDGYAATLLARWLHLPMILTLRGKEERQMRMNVRGRLVAAINGADRLICVSEALRNVAIHAGADADRVVVVGNGIDLDKFHAVSQADARRKLGVPGDAKVLISVGTLVERKGFHRVIECLPALLERFPNLHYLVVGGAGPEGDIGARLRKFVTEVGVTDRVHFLGAIAPDGMNVPLSAADVFVLATSYEGWANVFLEAMACGLPVVSTKVGGNPQVINAPHLGSLVEFGDQKALTGAIADALERDWDRERIVAYARENTWDSRIDVLLGEFRKIVAGAPERTREREGDNPVSRPQ